MTARGIPGLQYPSKSRREQCILIKAARKPQTAHGAYGARRAGVYGAGPEKARSFTSIFVVNSPVTRVQAVRNSATKSSVSGSEPRIACRRNGLGSI